MLILGVDPGAVTGWAVYESADRRVIASGQFNEHQISKQCKDWIFSLTVDAVVIERPKGQGPTRPQLVECGITFGRLAAYLESKFGERRVYEMLRYEVKSSLSAATHGEVNARNDASVWAALLLLHGGEDAGRKATKKNPVPGAIGLAKSHERAAVAVAVAWAIREGVWGC